MKREEVLQLLAAHRQELTQCGVQSLAIIGSLARDEARPDSDVDLLVEFNKPVGLFEFMRLKDYLETLLNRPVDLVTPDALKQQLRERILKEAVYVG